MAASGWGNSSYLLVYSSPQSHLPVLGGPRCLWAGTTLPGLSSWAGLSVPAPGLQDMGTGGPWGLCTANAFWGSCLLLVAGLVWCLELAAILHAPRHFWPLFWKVKDVSVGSAACSVTRERWQLSEPWLGCSELQAGLIMSLLAFPEGLSVCRL